jgi:hypothetical protein
MTYTTYTIKPGQSNFRPFENPLPVRKPKGFKVSGYFLPGGWCSKEEWEGDDDWGDWQKLKGITHFFSVNSHRTIMIAFRFGVEPGTYELTAYTNDKSYAKGWHSSGSVIVSEGEVFSFEAIFDGPRKVHYKGSTEGGQYLDEVHTIRKFTLCREVGTFAGGDNNSPGPYGGKAVKEMSINLKFEIEK